MNTASRIPSLDGLRGIAAVVIMIFHYNNVYLPQAALRGMLPLMRPFLDHAYLAVDLFFLMSGFVMAHVYGRQLSSNLRAHWWDFTSMRFARIYPLFAATTVVMVATRAWSGLPIDLVSFSGRSLALQPLLLQAAGDGLSWNYPSWSISTEAAAYVFFAFAAGLLLRGRYPRFMAAACIAILAVLCSKHQGHLHLYWGISSLLRTLAEFSLGVLLWRAHAAGAAPPRIWPGVIASACAALAVFTGWDLPVVGVLAYLIHQSVLSKSTLAPVLNSAPAVALGAWSYSLYLWHVPVHYAVMSVFAAGGHPVETLSLVEARWLMLATMLAVVYLSYVSFTHFEVPVRRWLRRRLMPAVPQVQTGIAAPVRDTNPS
ncbi:MAG: acyltransferase [Steroidobacteraceae bacterium]